ncbi:MAG: transcriptional regulator [Blastocatellia bacterium]
MTVANNLEPTLDTTSYSQLLAKTTPKIIENETEYTHFLSLIEELLEKGEEKTIAEINLLKLLVCLVEQYEEENYQLKVISPNQLLQHLMQARNLRAKDLIPLFNSSGYTSDIVNGKRPITVGIAKKLGDFFQVEPGLFVF